MRIFRKSKSEVNILTACPQANGFYKAGMVKKWIPHMYREFELNLLKKCKNNQKINLFEYVRKDWTFHAKGAWIYEGSDTPNMTVIGSSNYSYRSNRRDTEAQLYIYSKCPDFNERMKEEAEQLFSLTSQTSIDDIKSDRDTKLGIRSRILSKTMKSML